MHVCMEYKRGWINSGIFTRNERARVREKKSTYREIQACENRITVGFFCRPEIMKRHLLPAHFRELELLTHTALI